MRSVEQPSAVLLVSTTSGALSAAEDRRRFEDHIAGCDGCTAYLEQLRTTMNLAGKMGVEVVPLALEAELLMAFRDWRRRA